MIRHCLAKDRDDRWASAHDVRLQLEWIAGHPSEVTAAQASPNRRREMLAWTTAAALFLGAAALFAIATGIGFLAQTLAARAQGERCRPPVPEDRGGHGRESSTSGGEVLHAVCPLARRHAAHLRAPGDGQSQLFLRELFGFETRPIPGTEMATTPFFSPDGHWIGFWRAEDRILRKVSLAGGSPIEIAPTDAPLVALWTSNDEIVIESGDQNGELWSIPGQRRHAQSNRRPGSLRRRADFHCEREYPVAMTFSSPALAPTEPGSMCCHVRRKRDDDCYAAAATSWRATRGPAISCSRTATRYGPCL